MKEKKYSLIEMLKSHDAYIVLCTQKQYHDLIHRVARIKANEVVLCGDWYATRSWIIDKILYEWEVTIVGAYWVNDKHYKVKYIKMSEIDLVIKPRRKEK